MCLDEFVAADHRVRLMWGCAEGLDQSTLCREIMAVEGGPGHPPADPRILIALWLYAKVEGIGSAHELVRLRKQQGAYQWLCGRVGMNHKTLSDLRVGQDGVRVRVRASAGAASFRRHSMLGECHRQARQRVERLRAERTTKRTASDGRVAAGTSRPSRDAPAGAYGRRPGQHLANGGFAKLDNIETLARAGYLVFVPVPQPRHKCCDSHQPRHDDAPEVAAWQRRMADGEAKVVYRQRTATAEPVNVQARN